MALVLFLAFFLLSHLFLPSHGQGNYNLNPQCPSSFNCGEIGSFQYPFYNNDDTNPLCGLCQLNCSGEVPKIQLGNGPPFEIIEKRQLSQWSATLLIRHQLFEKHLDGRRCENLNDLTIPSSPSITFTILNGITVFKCQKSTEFTPDPDNFFNSYAREGNCTDFDLYYTLSKSIPVPTNLPPNCKVIHLPVHPPDPMKNANPTDLFSLVTAQFYIELSLTRNCSKCHEEKGLCINENEIFQCENTKQETKKSHLAIIITGVLGAGAAISISMIILIFCFRKKFMVLANSSILWRKKTDNYLNVEAFIKNLEFLAPKRYSRSDIKKMTNSFNVKLGQGAFGSVYKGTLCNGNLVAVKVLNESKGNGEDFINEVASVGRTSHVNIVSLLGFCFEGRQRYLIYEFMSNGSLEKFIYDRSSLTNCQLGWEKLYQIAIGIARGLEYLHRGCNTQILHFDIKPHNILLDQDFCPKISDFGLAKLFPDKRSVISMSGMRGTPGYIAPELFSRNFGGISHKSDVYSYGMMALEMVGGRKNIEAIVDHSSEIYFPHWIYKRLELEEEALGLHGIVNEEENEKAKKMIIVGLWCIQTDPLSRPSMTRVLEMLEGSLESLQIPPKPFLSSPSRLPQSSTELSMTVE